MTDEEPTVEEPTTTDVETTETEERYTPIYASESSILELTKFIGNTPSDSLLDTVMENGDNTVNSRLSRHSLPTYTSENVTEETVIPGVLKLCANYYAVSDLLQSVYGKDDRSTNEEAFYQKAENLITDYINQQLVELADTELKEQSPYGFSQSPDAFDMHLLHR